ncbi:MAG: ABC-F family ATP-binding cassette domain-containing protein [Rhizobacter sp.]|nr:ABC-F family ATP-binding cassette domain-containing protein [Chlorobiales bacterium]
MLEARNLNLSIGTKDLLKEASFRIGDSDRVGLVGLNGAGKSTLLRFINSRFNTSQPESTTPALLKSSATTIGYLPQEISFEGDLERTALDYAMRANEKLFQLAQDLHAMEHALGSATEHESDAYHKLIHDFTDATESFDRQGGYRMQSEAEKILSGLGFGAHEFHKKVKEFSGGWQMRLLIAKLLLQKHSLLMLDEPTNHLDIDSLHWLEDYLLGYDGSYIIVSHDKFFLDKLTTKTLEISFQKLTEYKGNYTFYEKEKEARYELAMQRYQNDKKKMSDLQGFVDRFRYKASKARQAQSRLKMLEKLEAGLETPEEDLSQISFAFPKAIPSGRVVMTLKDVAKSYTLPDGSVKQVLKEVNLEILRGDKIAIVGSNGAGKSTLCKILTGGTDFSGDMILGHNVSLNYYAQQQAESLDVNKTMLQEMLDAAPDSEARKRVRDILGCFLFSGETVERRIGVLSGGEKSRVALARMLLMASNLLIMDEPTNHLDMRSKEMLIESLDNYDGTMLLVSHDRYFLDSLVNKVIEIKKGEVSLYQMTYAEFSEKSERELSESSAASKANGKSENASGIKVKVKGDAKPALNGSTNGTNGTAKADKKKVTELEKQIEKAEKEKLLLEATMSQPEFYRNEVKAKEISLDYKSICNRLETLYYDWERASV